MRVALYARVSTKRQEKQGTISSQIEALRSYAKENNHEVDEDYVCCDNGYSGALLARPALDRLRDAAQAGAIDTVLVHSPDRLSRKYAYLILILEEFERFGTPVHFLEQPPSDDPHTALLVQIQGAVAEYERTKLSERYRRGKLYRARQGEVFWATIPYGYRRIPRRDGVAAHLVIHEPHAAIVRLIFAWHVGEEMTIRQIAKRLTREGYPTPKGGKQWGETTVHRILHREAYLGSLNYNQSKYVIEPSPNGGPPIHKRIPRPQSEWIQVSIPVIIDAETFERSQARHTPNEQFSPRNLHEEKWLLRRLLRCSKCGLKCACVADKRRPHMPPSYYYRCDKQDRVLGRPRCRPSHARTEPIDELVWNEVKRCLTHPELLCKVKSKLDESQSLDESAFIIQIQNTKKRLGQVQAERRRLIDAFQSGLITKKELTNRIRTVETRVAALQDDLVVFETQQRNAEDGNQLIVRIGRFTSMVTNKLDNMTFHERQSLVRQVLEEVTICDNRIRLFFKIPLPPPETSAPKKSDQHVVSREFGLRSHSDDQMDMRMKFEIFSKCRTPTALVSFEC